MGEQGAVLQTAARPLTDRSRAAKRRLLRKFPAVLWVFWAALLLFSWGTTEHPMMGVLFICGLWEVLAFLWFRVPRTVRVTAPVGRIELHEQGAVYRSPLRRKVLPFSRVTAFWETQELLMLCSDKTEIVWQASDLTAGEAAAIREFVSARLPADTAYRRGVLVPRLAYPLEVPRETECVAPATARCAYDATGGLLKEWGEILLKAGGIYLYLSVWFAWLMTDAFVWHTPFLNESMVWCGAAVLVVCPFLTLALLWLFRRGRKKAMYAVGQHAQGLYLTDGVNQKIVPRGRYRVRREETGCRVRFLGGGEMILTPQTPEEWAVFEAIAGEKQ